MSYLPFKELIWRKLIYLEKCTTFRGILSTYYRFTALQELIQWLISYNVLFRFVLDLNLNLLAHLPSIEFTFFKIDFRDQFTIPFEKIEKARYGMSRYDTSIYDPPTITPTDLEQLIWDLTYHTTKHDALEYRHHASTLKQYIFLVREQLRRHEFAEHYLNTIESIISLTEGKVLKSGYWGVACWDVSAWTEEIEQYSVFDARSIEDWKTVSKLESIFVGESWWEVTSWDYSRWIDVDAEIKPELEDFLDNTIKDFWKHVEPLYTGYLLLSRSEQLHYQGTKHQLHQANIIRQVKKIVNQYGVPSIQVQSYIAFALELSYRARYKGKLEVDDIVMKYERLGLNREILLKIVEMIKYMVIK